MCVCVCVCVCVRLWTRARARLSCCDFTVLLDGKNKQKSRNILEETGREISLCIVGINCVLALIIINESMEIILNMHYMRLVKT